MTSAGRFTASMTRATEYVFPEPVTPSSTWFGSPRPSPSASWSMACCWSPRGSKGLTTRNGRAVFAGGSPGRAYGAARSAAPANREGPAGINSLRGSPAYNDSSGRTWSSVIPRNSSTRTMVR